MQPDDNTQGSSGSAAAAGVAIPAASANATPAAGDGAAAAGVKPGHQGTSGPAGQGAGQPGSPDPSAPARRRRPRKRGRGGKAVKIPGMEGPHDGNRPADAGIASGSDTASGNGNPNAAGDPVGPGARGVVRGRHKKSSRRSAGPGGSGGPGARFGTSGSGESEVPAGVAVQVNRPGRNSGTKRGKGPRPSTPQPAIGSDGGVDFKLQKLLAEAGLGSRRDMEEAIASGRVSVNGKIAGVGTRITRRDVVRVDGRPIKIRSGRETPEVLLYHKPAGEIVSHDDPEGRPSVFAQVPPPQGGKWLTVGRLDFNTEGLLILTNSGDLANRLMHPRYEVEREYSVRVVGELTDDQMDSLLDGIELDDGPARFLRLEEGEFSDEGAGTNRWYRVMIREGRNREVRRMFEAVGVLVSRLIRTRFGPIALPRGLARGQSREATPDEVRALTQASPSGSARTGAPVGPGAPAYVGHLPGADPQLAAGRYADDAEEEGERADDIDGNRAPPSESVRRVPGKKPQKNARPPRARAGGPFKPGGGRGAGQANAASVDAGDARRRRGKGRLAGTRAIPGPGNAAAGKAARGRGPALKKGGKPRRGKPDPASMTLDGRRAVPRRLKREDTRVPAPKKMPVIIHRRSRLKIMPEPGEGGEGA